MPIRSPRRVALRLVAFLAAASLASPAPAVAAYVYIDPGHGGPYSNANANGLREETVNLQIALELRRQLRNMGHRVDMTRDRDTAVYLYDRHTWNYSDTYGWRFYADGVTRYSSGVPRDDLQARCDKANYAGADLLVSIHNNGASSSAARGTETYAARGRDPLGDGLSAQVQRAVVEQTGLSNRGDKNADYYVLRWSNMPAILVEGAFITNPSDAALLKSASFRAKLAKSIAIGIQRWLATSPYRQHWPRLAGPDRYSTATTISAFGWPGGSETVLLASDAGWPDALASTPLARKLDAPLLYTAADRLPDSTAAELGRLRPSEVIVLGGPASIEETLVPLIAAAASVEETAVRRIGGADRFETAALLAEEVGLPTDGTVVLATGMLPADTLSVVPYAASRGWPILLTTSSGLATATADYVEAHRSGITRTYIMGSTAAVADSAASAMPGERTRIQGPTRYETNVAVLDRFYAGGTATPYVVHPERYTDALAATGYAAKVGRPILLVASPVMHVRTREWITRNRPRTGGYTLVGGPNALPYLTDWMLYKADYE